MSIQSVSNKLFLKPSMSIPTTGGGGGGEGGAFPPFVLPLNETPLDMSQRSNGLILQVSQVS